MSVESDGACGGAERFRLPPGPVRTGTVDRRLLTARPAVVRRRHRPLCDARPFSHQVLGRQRPGRTTRDARRQVHSPAAAAAATCNFSLVY